MEHHYTDADLERFLTQPIAEAEMQRTARHLWSCGRCRSAAAEVASRCEALPASTMNSRTALLCHLKDEARAAEEELKAAGWWADLKELPFSEQMERVRSVAAYRSEALVRLAIQEAWGPGTADPHLGAQAASLAHRIAGLLPENRCPKAVKNDLRGKALTALANCRRLLADWDGSLKSIAEANAALAEGTADPALEGVLLNIQALLCADTGNLEASLTYSDRALHLYRELGDRQGVAKTAVLHAATLLAGWRADEAITNAQQALQHLGPADGHLELLATGILVEALVIKGRPREALHVFRDAQAVFERATDAGTQRRVMYLKARLLEGNQWAREAEKIYEELFQSHLDEEQYREAFRILLTLFEFHCRRGDLKKAAGVCRKALTEGGRVERAFNPQIRKAWQDLLAAVQVGGLGDAELMQAHEFFIRNWSGRPSGFTNVLPEVTAAPDPEPVPPTPAPPLPVPLPAPDVEIEENYDTALDELDRKHITAALEKAGGSQRKACRLLGLSRNGLRSKMRRLGI